MTLNLTAQQAIQDAENDLAVVNQTPLGSKDSNAAVDSLINNEEQRIDAIEKSGMPDQTKEVEKNKIISGANSGKRAKDLWDSLDKTQEKPPRVSRRGRGI